MSESFYSPPNQRVIALYRAGLWRVLGGLILLLTTTGRRSGQPRTTPLQYEQVGGDLYIGSARGVRADWFRNILADPCVQVQAKGRRFQAMAEPVTDAERIADFLELRLQRHPRLVGRILASEGLPAKPSRQDLVRYAGGSAMVILHPDGG